MKMYHLSLHNGCMQDIKYVCSRLNIELITETYGPQYDGGYNVSHARASRSWNKMKDMLNSFDVFFTSDTAPMSRIVLQHMSEFKKRVVVWVCNRFDVYSGKPNIDNFPDPEYYEIMKQAAKHERVKIISYTPFEYVYGKQKEVDFGSPLCIKPTGLYPKEGLIPMSQISYTPGMWKVPPSVNKFSNYFITPYHNDNIFMDLQAQCSSLGIKTHRGFYMGPEDIIGFLGIIHIPYAWSNLAFFENLQNNIPYFIPSKNFILDLSTKGNFFWSPPFQREHIELSEWYNPEHREFIHYFDSWEDLRQKTLDIAEIERKKKIQKDFGEKHLQKTLSQWKTTLCI